MADLLTHVLVAYVLLTIVGWRVEALTRRWVAVGTGGAAIPDLVKVDILLRDETVGNALGIPFSYAPLSTLGGVLLVSGIIAVAFGADYRRRAYAFLVVGGVLSLVGDSFRIFVDGSANPWFYPVTWWRPPSPNLYVSSDYRVLAVALFVASAVYLFDRHLRNANDAR